LQGVVAREKGEWDNAKKLFEESLKTREIIGDQIGIASALGNLGALAYPFSFLFFFFFPFTSLVL
jgi:hypothetical protein